MFKLIKYAFELIVPIALIFVVIPKMVSILKDMLGFGEPKKKKKKPNLRTMRQVGLPDYRYPPPPPPSRRMGDYELKGGRLVKKDQTSYDKRDKVNLDEWEVLDGQIRKRKKKKQHEQAQRDVDRVYKDIKRDKGVSNNPKVETITKKKHFSKGVDPDFL